MTAPAADNNDAPAPQPPGHAMKFFQWVTATSGRLLILWALGVATQTGLLLLIPGSGILLDGSLSTGSWGVAAIAYIAVDWALTDG